MDYDELYRLLPKEPKRWNQQEVLVWLKHIGYSTLDHCFLQETVDGACLEVLVDQDLLDMGVTSTIQRKKLLQWIQLGLKEYGNFVRLKGAYMDIQLPKQLMESKQNYNSENIDENVLLGNLSLKNQFQSRPIMNLEKVSQPKYLSQTIISEDELAKQVQQQRKGIFDNVQPIQVQNKIILQTQQKQKQESEQNITNSFDYEYHLPHFGNVVIPKKENQLKINIIRDGHGQIKGQPLIITGTATIGRNPENTMVLNNESVSRTHIWISLKEDQFYLQDRGSLIGTYILLEGKTRIQKGFILQIEDQDLIIQNLQTNQDFCTFSLNSEYGDRQISIKMNECKQFEQISLEYNEDGLSIEDLQSEKGIWVRLSKSGVQSQLVPITRRKILKISEFIIMLDPQY